MTARTHLLTGAGSGIGAVLAQRLHERGDTLVLLARNEQRAEQLRASYDGARTVAADLSEPASLDSIDLPDRLDSVVHAAGVVDLGPVASLSTQSWLKQVTVNLVAPAALTRIALPALRSARGTVVFVNSGAGLSAHPQWSAYAASKHGLKALADALRGEEADRGVRVTTVYPGRTATAMQQRVHEQEGADYDPAALIDAGTVADAVLHCLDLPPDAVLSDLTLRPTPGAAD